MIHDIPYEIKCLIIEYSFDHKKFRQHIQTDHEEDFMTIIYRINKENSQKNKLIEELQNIHTQIYIKIRQDNRILSQSYNDISKPLSLHRSLNYLSYFDFRKVRYLYQHPRSINIHITTWRNDVIILFNSSCGVSIIHYHWTDDILDESTKPIRSNVILARNTTARNAAHH